MASVVIVGNGGREHAIAWRLAQSPRVARVLVDGLITPFENKVIQTPVPSAANQHRFLQWCLDQQVHTFFSSMDFLQDNGLACFGPSKDAAQLETSKSFSKSFMERHEIPTARFAVFCDVNEACAHIEEAPYEALVIKASGLAAGKGVIVASNKAEAKSAAKDILGGSLGNSGKEIVIEEKLSGFEVSCLAFTDGTTVVPLLPVQDHKQLLDGDVGPNTGGMGAYAPCPLIDKQSLQFVSENILYKTIHGMQKEGIKYSGVIYAGIMVTPDGPKVLEFNCRFGDPETQVLMTLINSDLFEIMEACQSASLLPSMVSFEQDSFAVAVVLASCGYPGPYNKGIDVKGLGENHQLPSPTNVQIFHAGIKKEEERLVTSGGRVLSVVTKATSLSEAVSFAYNAVAHIQFTGMQFRHDIGHHALKNKSEMGYRDAGVDIDAGNQLVELIKPLAVSTKRPGCDADLGGFGGLFDLKATGLKDPLLVSGTDGVGTKLLIAQATQQHKTIGIDLVAMCVNDILACGAQPLFFLDYMASGKLDVSVMHDVVEGIATGCRQANCGLIGGETAEMPGLYQRGEYELAGFAVGAVEREQVLPCISDIVPGDIVLGLPSSGVHSNGFSLVRKVVSCSGLSYSDICPFDPSKTLGEALLSPTCIYAQALASLPFGLVKAIAHITGGGLIENIPRILPKNCGVCLNAKDWEILPVFQWLHVQGNVPVNEMARAFNLGLGLCLIVDKTHLSAAEKLFHVRNIKFFQVGSVNALEHQQHQVKKPPRKRVAVFISGSGTNLQAIIDASRNETDYPAEVSLVLSNKPHVKGLERARIAGIPSIVVDHRQFNQRVQFEDEIQKHLEKYYIELVVLAGFMRILTSSFVDKWKGRILNTHPALLPSFKGMYAVRDAIRAGVRISGCTVHFVEAEVDAGAIVAQEAVPVLPSDTEDILANRIKEAEHSLYPRALAFVASGQCVLGDDGRISNRGCLND
eukprot:gene9993-2168_t